MMCFIQKQNARIICLAVFAFTFAGAYAQLTLEHFYQEGQQDAIFPKDIEADQNGLTMLYYNETDHVNQILRTNLQGYQQWVKYYTIPNSQTNHVSFYSLLADHNGGWLTAGDGNRIMRLDQNGNTDWFHQYSLVNHTQVNSSLYSDMIHSYDERFMALGRNFDLSSQHNIGLIKFENNGTPVAGWKCSLPNDEIYPNRIIQAQFEKQGYLVLGNYNENRILVWALDKNMGSIWTREIQLDSITHHHNRSVNVIQTQNEEILIVTQYTTNPPDPVPLYTYKLLLIKLDKHGSMLWNRAVEVNNDTRHMISEIFETPQGDILLIDRDYAFDYFNIFPTYGNIIKLQGSNGSPISVYKYPLFLSQSVKGPNGGYFVPGGYAEANGNNPHMRLLKIDDNGRTYCSEQSVQFTDLGSKVIIIDSRSIPFVSKSVNHTGVSGWENADDLNEERICTTNRTGKAEPSKHSSVFTLYPNPSNGNTLLTFEENDMQSRQLHVFNMQGQLVRDISIPAGTNAYKISLTTPGMYIVKVRTGQTIQEEKLIIR